MSNKRKVINNENKYILIPSEYNSWEEYNNFLRSISKINGKPWYQYDFSDLDVVSLFENEKK